MRTTVTLSEPLLKSAKRRASERDITLSELVEDALRILLAQKPQTSADRFRLHTVAGRLVNPDLNLDRTSALEAMEDELKFAGPQNK